MKIGYSKETGTYWDMDTGQRVDKDVVQMGNLGAAWEGVQRLGGDIARNVTGLLPGGPLMDPRSPEEEQRWEQVQAANRWARSWATAGRNSSPLSGAA